MQQDVLMSHRKLVELQEKLNRLENKDFPRNRRSMKEAMESGGGMHDNAAYEHALQDERLLLQRIADLRAILSRARIIEPLTETKIVCVSCRIRACELKSGKLFDMIIGGYMDTDLDRNWYSYQSPLATSFIGKQVGDLVRFVSPTGEERAWEILEIVPINLEKKGG